MLGKDEFYIAKIFDDVDGGFFLDPNSLSVDKRSSYELAMKSLDEHRIVLKKKKKNSKRYRFGYIVGVKLKIVDADKVCRTEEEEWLKRLEKHGTGLGSSCSGWGF